MKATVRGFISSKFHSVRENSTMTSVGWKEKDATTWSNVLTCIPKRLQEAWESKISGGDLVNLEGDVMMQAKQVISTKFIETLGGLDIPEESKLAVAQALKSHIYTEQVAMLMVRGFSKLDRTVKAEQTQTTEAPAAAPAELTTQQKIEAILNAKKEAVAA